MNETLPATHEERLDAYARKLEKRLVEMRASGGLKKGYAGLTHEIEERRRLLRERVAEAIRAGKFLNIMVAELRRDYSSLFDNVLGFERAVDWEFASNSAARAATPQPQDLAKSARNQPSVLR